MGCSCSLPQSPPLLQAPWTPCDRKGHKWGKGIQSKQLSLFHVFYFHSLWPFCFSQSTSTGNGVTKQGASSWGGPFSLRPLRLPLIFQQAGKYAIAGLCFSVDTGDLITVVLSAGFDKREEQNNLSSRSKNVPGLVQTQKLPNKGQTLNLVQNCGLWKMWCGGWEERLCNPW